MNNTKTVPEDETQPTHHCGECGWSGGEEALDVIDDITERVAVGELMPAGQCPACGVLISARDEDVPDYTLEACAEIAAERAKASAKAA